MVKDIFVSELEETVDSILRYSDGPCLILNVITDTHYNPYDEDNVRRTGDTFDNLRELNERVYSHGVVHMGDCTIHGVERDGVITIHGVEPFTQEISSRLISQVRGWMLKANKNVFMVSGNHDGAKGNIPLTGNYNSMATQSAHIVVREGENPYYYVDFDFVKVRAVFLSTNTAEEEHVWGVSNRQLNWIKRTLLGTPEDYNILIFSHFATYDTDCFRTNRKEVADLFNQFHMHSGDFAEKKGKCIAWCCGHKHFDWVVPTSFSGVLFPTIVNTCSLMHRAKPKPSLGYEGYINSPRIDSTKDQDAWDTLIYRPDQNMLYMIRFGSGDDRIIDLS